MTAPETSPSLRERLNSPLLRRHVVIGTISFTLAWVIVGLVLFPDTGPAPSVVVPAVVGLRFEEAER